MPTTYCSVEDVADFLRIPIDATTVPNKTQVEKVINRKEEVIDRRTGMTYGREKTETEEVHDLALTYTFGHGSPVFMKRRAIKVDANNRLDSGQGDKFEIWSGGGGSWSDETDSGQYNVIGSRGELYVRGYLYTIMRKSRIRLTYRYGEATVPDDIKDACIKMTAIDLLSASFRMDKIPMGGNQIDPNKSIPLWRDDVERIIQNREEWFVIP